MEMAPARSQSTETNFQCALMTNEIWLAVDDYPQDENFQEKHTGPGLLSMVCSVIFLFGSHYLLFPDA